MVTRARHPGGGVVTVDTRGGGGRRGSVRNLPHLTGSLGDARSTPRGDPPGGC